MKSATCFTPLVCKAVLFLFILFLLFNSAYSQLTGADQAKKAARVTVVKLQTAQTALGILEIKSSSVTKKLNKIEVELLALVEKINVHNRNQVTYDLDKPKPPNAIAYDIEKEQLNDSVIEITSRKTVLNTHMIYIQNTKDSLNFEIITLKSLLKHKSIDVLKFFNTYSCGQMPGEIAAVSEWRSYFDCLFDGTSRNRTDFTDPVNPGRMTIVPNDLGTMVIPENDPAASQQKQREIKKLLEETEKNKKTKQPVVVPSPTAGDLNENGGSLSAALKSLIKQLRPVSPKAPTAISTVRD